MSVLEQLYNLVKILNMNDDNEEKCQKIDGFIFRTHW